MPWRGSVPAVATVATSARRAWVPGTTTGTPAGPPRLQPADTTSARPATPYASAAQVILEPTTPWSISCLVFPKKKLEAKTEKVSQYNLVSSFSLHSEAKIAVFGDLGGYGCKFVLLDR